MPALLCTLILGAAGYVTADESPAPTEHRITVHSRKYGYEPSVIRVDRGDTVRLRFVAEDVVHGFYLEGYDLNVAVIPQRSLVELRSPLESQGRRRVEEVVFLADRAGKFRYRCSLTCGFLHPFMLGELIVGPSSLLRAGIGATAGMLLGSLLVALPRGGRR